MRAPFRNGYPLRFEDLFPILVDVVPRVRDIRIGAISLEIDGERPQVRRLIFADNGMGGVLVLIETVDGFVFDAAHVL